MKKRILISAYAVNPFKGSEDGTGWNISREIAKEHSVILISRKNNIPHIEKYLEENPDDVHANTQFIGYDLPTWVMWLKKKLGERGYVLYYYFWQMFLPLFIIRQKLKFDLAHALNFHSDNVPTFLWMLGKPTFWGPVGHHPKVPKEFILRHYGYKAYLKDRLYFAVKWTLRHLDPFYALAVRKVDKIFAINSSVGKVMGAKAEKVEVIPAVGGHYPNLMVENTKKQGFNILSVGRFTYMKGFDVAINAFAEFYWNLTEVERRNTTLTLVGSGEEENRLKMLAEEMEVAQQVKWIKWVDRKEMDALYQAADLFFFPSHEGAGMVVPEAMSHGLPVLTFDNVGPGELAGLAGTKVPYSTYDETIEKFANELDKLFHADRELESNLSKVRFNTVFTWEAKGKKMLKAFKMPSKSLAVFHPTAELYGADRIMVNTINTAPEAVKKVVYLKFDGPLVDYIQEHCVNTEVKVVPQMPIIYRNIFTPSGIVKFAKEWMQFYSFLRKEKKENQIGTAYVNTLSNAFILPMLKLAKYKTFMHVHEIIDSPKLVGWATAQLCNYFADEVVCVSQAVLEGVSQYSDGVSAKSRVIHNGIDPVQALGVEDRERISFYLFGRIMPKKGQWFLIEALKRVPVEVLSKARFTLMGGTVPGKEADRISLEQAIVSAGLEKVVTIKDFAPNIVDAMADADVCLVPSLMKDPFPTTVLEAMSAGRPVIATNHGGAKEAISGSMGGVLVEPNDPEELSQRIIEMILNKEVVKEMGVKAREKYQNSFTKEHFNTHWSNFLYEHRFIAA